MSVAEKEEEGMDEGVKEGGREGLIVDCNGCPQSLRSFKAMMELFHWSEKGKGLREEDKEGGMAGWNIIKR